MLQQERISSKSFNVGCTQCRHSFCNVYRRGSISASGYWAGLTVTKVFCIYLFV